VKTKRAPAPPYDPRQRCLICAIVEDLIDIAEADLHIGRLDDVGEALSRMRAQITGRVYGTPRGGDDLGRDV
jgi:hypothetical protein